MSPHWSRIRPDALFRIRNGSVERITEDRALSIEALAEELSGYNETIYLAGDGAELCAQAFSDRLPDVILTPVNIRFQHAYGTAAAAEKMASENRLCDADSLMPIYLRIPQAERERKARQEKEKRNN